MAALQRTHLLKDDFDWLPKSSKRIRWISTGVGAALACAAGAFIPGAGFATLLGFGKMWAIMVATSTITLTPQALAARRRRRVRKMAHGQIDLRRLKREPDGQLVHVVGRIRARQTLPSILTGEPVVFRRTVVQADAKPFRRPPLSLPVVYEAAFDFGLVDESGEEVLLDVADARLIVSDEKFQKLPAGAALERVWALVSESPEQSKRPSLRVSEVVVLDGDRVEVVGYKTRVVDVSVAERMERDTPLRATLRSGAESPLLITLSPHRLVKTSNSA